MTKEKIRLFSFLIDRGKNENLRREENPSIVTSILNIRD